MNDQNQNEEQPTVTGPASLVIFPSVDQSDQLPGIAVGFSYQTVIPGSVTPTDLKRVFDKFVDWVGWDNPELVPAAKKKLIARSKRLQSIREKIQRRLDKLDAKLSPVLFQLRTAEEMKTEAAKFLMAAVDQVGALGSPEVLLAVMKKKYPKVIVRAREDAAPSENPSVPAQAESKPEDDVGGDEPAPSEPEATETVKEEAVRKVGAARGIRLTPDPIDGEGSADSRGHKLRASLLAVLDSEGMSAAEVAKASGTDAEVVKKHLAVLLGMGSIEILKGSKPKKYKLTTKE